MPDDPKHYGSIDLMILVCHVIWLGQVVKGWCDFMG